MLKEFDKIRLVTGEVGRILEDFNDGTDQYLAEIYLEDGEIDTTEIKKSDIKSIFVETEHPYIASA